MRKLPSSSPWTLGVELKGKMFIKICRKNGSIHFVSSKMRSCFNFWVDRTRLRISEWERRADNNVEFQLLKSLELTKKKKQKGESKRNSINIIRVLIENEKRNRIKRRHSQPNWISAVSPSLSFYLTFIDIDLPKNFPSCFLGFRLKTWKEKRHVKMERRKIGNSESIVIFSKPQGRRSRLCLLLAVSDCLCLRSEAKMLKMTKNQRWKQNSMVSFCHSFINVQSRTVNVKKKQTSQTKRERHTKNVFIAGIDFLMEEGKGKNEKKLQDVDRRKQRRKEKAGEFFFHTKIHHLTNPLGFQGFVYVSNSNNHSWT